jgi:ankyrin repeat protein
MYGLYSQQAEKDRGLYDAATRGNRFKVLEFLQQGASPHQVQAHLRTALHAAAENGHVEVVQELSKVANVDAVDSDGNTPLYLAAVQRHVDVAAVLLAARATANIINHKGLTPLHAAAGHGDMPLMKMLLSWGANVHPVDGRGYCDITPLHQACMNGNNAASLLLATGAAVYTPCAKGFTALHYAAEAGHLDVVVVLLRAKASMTAVTKGGLTPLYLASKAGHEQVVRLLLRSGAPSTQSNGGWLALHGACDVNQIGVVKCLLREMPTWCVNAGGPEGATGLHLASKAGWTKVVQLLLKAGADVNIRDSQERSPLHYAIIAGQSAMVEQLLAAGADPRAAAAQGMTTLHAAVQNGNAPILQQLLATMPAGPGDSIVDATFRGSTPLHSAVERGLTSCVEVLLAAGADRNKLYGPAAVTANGSSLAGATGLHRAVQLKHTALVPLLATPANMRHLWQGDTPLHMALYAAEEEPGEEEKGAAVQIAQALVAAASPAGVPDSLSSTAMWVAATSSRVEVQDLLPAMVRRECERYKQLQQEEQARQQQPLLQLQSLQLQQRQRRQPQSEEQQDPAAVLAAVVDAVMAWLNETAAASSVGGLKQGVACLQMVMEVLGEAAASSMVQQLLVDAQGVDDPATGSGVVTLLCRVVHRAWYKVVFPLMQQRWRVTNRLQQLVTHTLPQQQKQPHWQRPAPDDVAAGASGGEAGVQEVDCRGCRVCQCSELSARAAAAAGAGQWGLFMEVLEQLTGLHEACGGAVMYTLEQQQGLVGVPDAAGLCEALLGSWATAQKQVAGRMWQERKDLVVRAVQVVGRQPARAAGGDGIW